MEDSAVSQSNELQTILADLIDAQASTPALVGVLSAIPGTLREKEVRLVADAVRNALRQIAP